MNFFVVNDEWKNKAPVSFKNSFEGNKWKDIVNYKKYILLNEFVDKDSQNYYKPLITEELFKIISFFETAKENGEINNLINLSYFKYNNDILLKCPITNKPIRQNENVFLLTILKNEGKDEEEFIYYFVGKNAYEEFVKLYYNKFNEVDIKEEQILGEVLLNKRWGNEIYNMIKQRKQILQDFKDTRDVLSEMIDKFDMNLLVKYEEEEEQEIKEENIKCETL